MYLYFLYQLFSLLILVIGVLFLEARKRLIIKLKAKNLYVKYNRIFIVFICVITIAVMPMIFKGIRDIKEGYSYSFYHGQFNGNVGLKLEKRTFSLDEEVPFMFSYGQVGSNTAGYEGTQGIDVKVFVREIGVDDYTESIIYSKSFEGESFYSNENLCECRGLKYLFIENKYKQNYDAVFDFNTLDYEEGILVAQITLIIAHNGKPNGIVELHEIAELNFIIEDGKIHFSH